MGIELKDVIKVSAGIVLSAAALRQLQKVLQTEPQAPALEAPPADGAPQPPAREGAAGARPEDGVWIYFGSQSGTAEGFAKELEQEARESGVEARAVDFEGFDPARFCKHKVVVLVVATYGEGDPTDNAVDFFKWLKSDDVRPGILSGVHFTVMGLGNRQYANFNSCGKQADEWLEKHGGTRVHDLGLGDDDKNIEDDFEQWKSSGLWAALRTACGEAAGPADSSLVARCPAAEDAEAGFPLRADIQVDAARLAVDPLVQRGGDNVVGKWYFQARQATVVGVRELRQKPDIAAGRSSKHLDLDVAAGPAIEWRTADNLEILPSNPDETVEWFASRLGVHSELDRSMAFVRAHGVERQIKAPFPAPCTVREALALYCDLCQAPSRSVAKRFVPFIQDEAHRAAFASLVEDRPAYQSLIGEGARLTFRELFELFLPSAVIDFGVFLQLCPRQKNRPYTIASSSAEDETTIGVCVSVVAESLQPLTALLADLAARGHAAPGAAAHLECFGGKAQEPRSFRGACSQMLCGKVAVGDRLWINARPSTFRLPCAPSVPVIMVGAGTGIAPFRGFIREFAAEEGARQRTTLVFGCTRSTEDFLYREELEAAVRGEPRVLSELVTAFSREQEEKVYVQHRVRDRAPEIAAQIGRGAHVYVCGAVAMGAAIRDELNLALGGGDCVGRLQAEGRFVEELW